MPSSSASSGACRLTAQLAEPDPSVGGTTGAAVWSRREEDALSQHNDVTSATLCAVVAAGLAGVLPIATPAPAPAATSGPGGEPPPPGVDETSPSSDDEPVLQPAEEGDVVILGTEPQDEQTVDEPGAVRSGVDAVDGDDPWGPLDSVAMGLPAAIGVGLLTLVSLTLTAISATSLRRILPGLRVRASADLAGVGHRAEPVAHDDYVRGLDRDVGADADRAVVGRGSAGASLIPSPTMASGVRITPRKGGIAMRRRPIRRPFAASRAAAVGVAGCMAVVVFPGCSSQSSVDDDVHASRRTVEAGAVHEPRSGAAAVEAVDAMDLRAGLEQLLGQHAILTVRLTRARLRGDGDLAQSADAALSKNTGDLGELIGSVYGAGAAEEFEQLWFGHVTYLFDYSRGVADEDEAVKSQARRQLDDYTTNLGQFVEAATNQAAPASVVAPELRMHVEQLLQQVDAYARRDYNRAFALERESYAHMFPLGKALAAGILAGGGAGLPVGFDSPARQLQSRLGLLLGEHAELAVDAMRSGISNSPDFPAAGAALDGNTREITAVIESVFGAASAGSFQALWADHIDAFVAYTQALGADDAALEDAATERLKGFNENFAAFLSTSTQGRLGAPALADAFVMHEDLLLRQIKAYAERDYSRAHQLSFDAYQHMFALAAQAATAIGDTVAAQSPRGGMQTGLGGMAAAQGAP